MKLCINCKHCKKHYNYALGEIHICTKHSDKYISYRTGKIIYNPVCLTSTAREDNNRCTKEGNDFEERTDLWYKLTKWLKRSK